MNFKKWYLNEVGTGTNCVAVFARPIFGGELVSKTWPQSIAGMDYESLEKQDGRVRKSVISYPVMRSR